ncbi:hypothetical protein [Actinomadura madurae]|uniref:hypothetical protein n=1 Tax=Actinomadura madurae TaxID=1993 RepID=UPI0020D22403|nr:hypothetical protein [Actinomadura madurae]MCQ0018608.1 hypothetical protein [Actinomadura madurae]
MTPWAMAELDPERIAAYLARRFPGCCVWLGEYTGNWWAMTGDRLIEAPDPATLERLLYALARRAHARRYAAPPEPHGRAGHAPTSPGVPSGRARKAHRRAGEADRAAGPGRPAAAAVRLVRGRRGVVIRRRICDR